MDCNVVATYPVVLVDMDVTSSVVTDIVVVSSPDVVCDEVATSPVLACDVNMSPTVVSVCVV